MKAGTEKMRKIRVEEEDYRVAEQKDCYKEREEKSRERRANQT